MSYKTSKIPYTRRCEYEENITKLAQKQTEYYELNDTKQTENEAEDGSHAVDGVKGYTSSMEKPQHAGAFVPEYASYGYPTSKADKPHPAIKNANTDNIQELLIKESNYVIDFILTMLSIIFYFFDIVSDINLAYNYYKIKRWVEFWLTAAFVFIPLIVINITSLVWYTIDYAQEKKVRLRYRLNNVHQNKERHNKTSVSAWFLKGIFTFPFMMGTVVRDIEYLYHGWKCRYGEQEKRKYHHRQMLYENTDASWMKMLEAFLESAPQLILQMYIVLTESSTNMTDKGFLTNISRPVSMFSSFLGISWSLVSYHRALRAEKDNGLSVCGTVFYYMWRAFEIGPRILVLALFSSLFQWFIFIPISVHWVVMTIWLFYQKPNFYNKVRDQVAFNIIIGWVMILCFQNVKDGQTRYRAAFYYCILYVENLVLLLLWLNYTSHKSYWYYTVVIVIVPTSIILQTSMQLLYYKCFHPKRDKIDVFIKPCCKL